MDLSVVALVSGRVTANLATQEQIVSLENAKVSRRNVSMVSSLLLTIASRENVSPVLLHLNVLAVCAPVVSVSRIRQLPVRNVSGRENVLYVRPEVSVNPVFVMVSQRDATREHQNH